MTDRSTLEEVWDRDTEFIFCTLCLQYLWDIQVDCTLSRLEAYQGGAGVNCRFENIKAEWIVTVLSQQRLRLFSKECEAREVQGRRWKPRGYMPSRWKWRWTSQRMDPGVSQHLPPLKSKPRNWEFYHFYSLEPRIMPGTNSFSINPYAVEGRNE